MPSITDDLIDGAKERDQAFYLALQGDDDLGLVVRAHIHIEHELREFVKAAAISPDQVRFSQTDYEGTVRLALILGLSTEFKAPLTALGGLRNKFSHRLDMKIGDQEANGIYDSLGPAGKSVVQHSYASVRRDAADGRHPANFKDLPPKDRLMVSLVSLRGGIRIELLRALGKFDEAAALKDSEKA
jgi:hypothetical protein